MTDPGPPHPDAPDPRDPVDEPDDWPDARDLVDGDSPTVPGGMTRGLLDRLVAATRRGRR